VRNCGSIEGESVGAKVLQGTNQFSEDVISQSAKGDWKLVMGEMLQLERCALKCQKQIHKLLDSSLEVLAAISLRPSAPEEIAFERRCLKRDVDPIQGF
jgi:hypothetical protein